MRKYKVFIVTKKFGVKGGSEFIIEATSLKEAKAMAEIEMPKHCYFDPSDCRIFSVRYINA